MSVPSSFDFGESQVKDVGEMSFGEKVMFKSKQQPWVPIGCLLTTGAVVMAGMQLRRGNKRSAQNFFRWRVVLQGLTLATLVAGSAYYGKLGGIGGNTPMAEEQRLREKAKMREQLWIKELERREHETDQRRQKAEYFKQKALQHEQETKAIQAELKELESKSK